MTQRQIAKMLQEIASAASIVDGAERTATSSPIDGPPSASSSPSESQYIGAITKIWSDMLQVDVIDIDEDFFSLGGDSIILVQTLSQITSVLGLDLSLIELLDWQSVTVRSLAATISKHR